MADVITNRRHGSNDVEIHLGDVDAPDGYHRSVMVRIVGNVVLVASRRWDQIATYTLDEEPTQHRRSQSWIGTVDGLPLIVSPGCGCANQPTTFTPKGGL